MVTTSYLLLAQFGIVKHRGELRPGVHEPLIGKDVFDLVEDTMRRNSGRSSTLTSRTERTYLLKGIIRCAHCLMPMWAQTYTSGSRLYREHRESRSLANCPSAGGSIPCERADAQIGKIVEAIELGPKWEEEVLSVISVGDEVEMVKGRRKKVQEKLKRLGRAYVDGVYDDMEYRRQKQLLDAELESLVVPEADAATEAGHLIEKLPELWAWASVDDRRRLLVTMLDAVYVDAKEEERIVAIKPRAPFKPIFQMATMKEGSGIVLVHERTDDDDETDQPPPHGHEVEADSCSWWRRGRVELYREHGNSVLVAA